MLGFPYLIAKSIIIFSFESEFEIKEVNPLLITLKLLILRNFRLRPIKSNALDDCFFRLNNVTLAYDDDAKGSKVVEDVTLAYDDDASGTFDFRDVTL